MMGMNTALAQCSSATLANNASKANDRFRTSTGMWSMRGAGAGGEAGGLCASHGFARGIVRCRLRCMGAAEGFLPRMPPLPRSARRAVWKRAVEW